MALLSYSFWPTKHGCGKISGGWDYFTWSFTLPHEKQTSLKALFIAIKPKGPIPIKDPNMRKVGRKLDLFIVSHHFFFYKTNMPKVSINYNLLFSFSATKKWTKVTVIYSFAVKQKKKKNKRMM